MIKGYVNKKWNEKFESRSLIKLDEKEIKFGWNVLNKLGVPKNSWFVCLHVRTAGFKSKDINKANNQDVHDAHRNAEINTYKKAMDSISKRGGWIIRMGDRYMPFIDKINNVIDYAHSEIQSDFMDVFLSSQCRFAVTTNSGYQAFVEIFEPPLVLTNYVPMATRARSLNEIFIYKLLKSKITGKILNFEKSMETPIGNAINTMIYKTSNIEWVDNTEDEINDVVIEMIDIVENNKIYSQKDEDLQKRFNLLHSKFSKWDQLGRIGQSFIEKYEYLL